MSMKPENLVFRTEPAVPDGVLPVLHPLLAHDRFEPAVSEFLARLVQTIDCDRASLGFVEKGATRICAVSLSPTPSRGAILPDVAAAMDESLLQDAILSYPAAPAEFPHILLAHTELVRRNALSAALTLPLSREGLLIGAITLETRRPGGFRPEQQQLLERIVSAASPLLYLKWTLQRPLPVRTLTAMRSAIPDTLRKVPRWASFGIGLLLLLLLATILFVPVSYRISTQARVEASIQRVITAPVDGYLQEIRVRPGDKVNANQPLAYLNDDMLRTEYRKLEAESQQHENSLVEAMARADRTQVAIRRAKLDEVNAQKDLVLQQLGHTQLVAPFDGVVIKGDLTQMLGSPIRRGDVMLVLSQGNGYRVMLEVPEHDIADIKAGQPGVLVVSALPSQKFSIRTLRVAPVATLSANGSNVFEVEATLDDHGASQLVPGLKGVARIEAGDKPLGAQWFGRAWERLRFLLWSHL